MRTSSWQRTAAGRSNPGQIMVRQLASKFLAQIEQDLQAFTPEWFADHPELAAARRLGQEELLSIADLPRPYHTLNDNLYDFLLSLVEERTSAGLSVYQLRQVLMEDTGAISRRLLLKMLTFRGDVENVALKVFAEWVDDELFSMVVKSFHRMAKEA